jgi:L-lactate dehydrogenase complex protein LldG
VVNDNRYEILTQIRHSLKAARLPDARATLPPFAPAPRADVAALVSDFMRELEAVGVKAYAPAHTAEAIDLVIRLLHASEAKELLAWADSELPLEGLGAAVRAAGFVPLDAQVPADAAGRRARLAELGRASVGLTGALAGLVDTGSLALLSGPGRPRLASLLPPVHVAILSKRALFPAMADFFAAHPNGVRDASNLVFITGPSRTADIEQTLTLGVHGPREVHVVLVA